VRTPKIGLALGSGGARGFAHVGVLKALAEANIKIDYIAGSSIGALVGALYGAGHDVEQLYKMATTFKRKYYLDFTVPKMGFVIGNKVKELLRILTHGKNIEQLSPPLAIVATDLLTGEKVVFTKGSAAEAVRASVSIPGIFIPEKIDGRLLVDGGVIDRVPVSVVGEMGADLVIAVDVSSSKGQSDVHSIFDVIMQSIDIMQHEMVRFHEMTADVMIKPQVKQFSSKSFTNVKEIITIGQEETKKNIPLIRSALENWKG
jgi:NTE family protein